MTNSPRFQYDASYASHHFTHAYVWQNQIKSCEIQGFAGSGYNLKVKTRQLSHEFHFLDWLKTLFWLLKW